MDIVHDPKWTMIWIASFVILPMRHPLDWNFIHQFHFSFIHILICILTYLLMIILSLLRIIVGSIAHNCWLLPAYLLIDCANISINDTNCDTSNTHTYIFTYIIQIHTMNVTCRNCIIQFIVFLYFKTRHFILLVGSLLE